MLEEIMMNIRNFFDVERIFGNFAVIDGKIEGITVADGEHIRVIGSRLNDGIHAENASLNDEEFEGAVWILRIPSRFLELVAEIEAWQKDNAQMGAYQSESFGGYSYQRLTGRNGQLASWSTVFESRLASYRKARL